MSETSKSEEAGIGPRETRGCVLITLLVLWVLGTITLFPWAREIHLTNYPNLNGILVSIGILVLGGILLIILGGITYASRDVLRWILIAIVGIIALAILWLILAAIWKWLFAPV